MIVDASSHAGFNASAAAVVAVVGPLADVVAGDGAEEGVEAGAQPLSARAATAMVVTLMSFIC